MHKTAFSIEQRTMNKYPTSNDGLRLQMSGIDV